MCAVLQAQVLTRPVAIASMKNSGLTFHIVLYKGTRPERTGPVSHSVTRVPSRDEPDSTRTNTEQRTC